jgi:hypothetical protein
MKVELIESNEITCQFYDEDNETKIFNVYGIYFYDGKIEFLMKQEEYGHTPVLVPASCFRVVDPSFHSSWVPYIDNGEFSIICKEWVEYPEHLNFFSSPWEYEEDYSILEALDSFHYWVELMDAEAISPHSPPLNPDSHIFYTPPK